MTTENPLDAAKLYAALPDLVPQKLNLNGTSKESLMRDYRALLDALRDVTVAMATAMPHGRDYQTHSDPEATEKARKAWGTRRTLVAEMLRDFEHSAVMVYEQN